MDSKDGFIMRSFHVCDPLIRENIFGHCFLNCLFEVRIQIQIQLQNPWIRILICTSLVRDLRIKTSDFPWNVGVGVGVWPTQSDHSRWNFFGGPWPLRTLLWFFFGCVAMQGTIHRNTIFFCFNKRVLSGHELSKKIWPWKVTVSRSNEQGRICEKNLTF